MSDVAEVNPALDRCPFPQAGDVHFVPMPAVEAKSGRIDVSQMRPHDAVRKGYTAFVAGDVLFAKITPCMENGKMAVVPALPASVAFGSTEFHVLRSHQGISPQYLYHFVSGQAFRHEAEHKMTGAVGQKRVPTTFVADHAFPLPPTREQHRIVAKIEELFSELDKAVESLTLARAQLTTYRQALLKAAFEGKLTSDWRAHDRPWRATRLGNEITYLTSGSRGWGDYYSDQGDIFIRAQNLKHDRLDLGDPAYVQLPKKATEGLRTRVQNGDVLITITGANVTKTGIVNRDIGIAYVSQHVALCRPADALRPEFLYWYLLSDTGGRRQLNSAAYGAGKPGLNLENIREVTLMLPEVDEQDEIIARLNSLISEQEHTAQSIQTETQRISVLRQSVLQRAFSGRLVPQDSDDEPATCLLERIRAAQGAPITVRRKRTAHA